MYKVRSLVADNKNIRHKKGEQKMSEKEGSVPQSKPLTVLAALELLTVLLLQGQLSLQLGDASLGELASQLLVLLDQHATLGHQLLARLAAREISLTSHSEPADRACPG